MAPLLSSFSGFFAHWASAFWMTLRETGPYLVFGLILAGFLHVFVPARIILWALGSRGWRGALRGSLVGLPLPLCSCGVVPTALTLRRQGASLSATTAFTISTPETSLDAIAITAALLPVAFLGFRPVAALLLSFTVGLVVEWLSPKTSDQLRMNVMNFSRIDEKKSDHDHDGEECCATEPTAEICRVCGLMTAPDREHQHGLVSRVIAIGQYAFGTFFKDIATWLMLGLLFASLIQILVPTEGFRESWLTSHPSFAITAAILMGIPLYSCATATTPLAAVLLAKGLDPGAVLALLLAGPATNIGNVFAFRRELGGRITVVYYVSLFVFCWIFGMAFHYLWPLIAVYPSLTSVWDFGGSGNALAHWIPGWIEVATAWILIALSAHVWGRVVIARARGDSLHNHPHGHTH